MKKLAINFMDNDFSRTIRAIGNSFLNYYNLNGQFDFDKKQTISLWNELSYGIYLLHQNEFRYTNSHEQSLRSYLKIDESNIHIDDEVDNFYYRQVDQGQGNFASVFIWFDTGLVEII